MNLKLEEIEERLNKLEDELEEKYPARRKGICSRAYVGDWDNEHEVRGLVTWMSGRKLNRFGTNIVISKLRKGKVIHIPVEGGECRFQPCGNELFYTFREVSWRV